MWNVLVLQFIVAFQHYGNGNGNGHGNGKPMQTRKNANIQFQIQTKVFEWKTLYLVWLFLEIKFHSTISQKWMDIHSVGNLH